MESDIRIERTKAALKNAFVQLLDDTSAYGISVTDLTRKANVSRVTFYIHYSDMVDFIESTCDTVLSSVKWSPSKELNLFAIDNAKLIIRKQVETVRQNIDIFRALLGVNGPDHFYDKFLDMIYQEYLFHISQHSSLFENDKDMYALIQYITAGELHLVTDWIRNDPVETNDVMVDRIVNLTFNGILKSYNMMNG